MSENRSSERLQAKKRDRISSDGADLVQPPTKKQATKAKQAVSSTRGRKRQFSSIQDDSSNSGPSKPSKIPRHQSISISSAQHIITRSIAASQEKKGANPKPQKEVEELSRKRKLPTSATTEKSIKKQRLNTVKDEPIGENKLKDEKIKQEKIKEKKESEVITAKDEEEQKLKDAQQDNNCEKAENEHRDKKKLTKVTGDAEQVKNQVKESVPKFMEPFVVNCQDVEGDGNCGFRAVAVSSGLRKGQYAHQSLRLSLRSLFRKNIKYYAPICNMLATTVEEVIENLSWNGGECVEDKQFWLQMPFHGYLIADLFKRPVVFMSKTMSATFFPKNAPSKNVSKLKPPICFVLYDDIDDDYYHYIPITLSENSPIPNVCVCIDSQGIEFQVPNHEAWTKLMADRFTDRFNNTDETTTTV